MIKFREYLRDVNEAKDKEQTSEYKEFFKKMLDKYDVEDPSELSKEDKIKFFDEVDAGWKAPDEKKEPNDVNEGIKYSDLDEADIKTFLKELNLGTKFIKDEVKSGNIGDVAGRTLNLINFLTTWHKKIVKSDQR